MESIKSKNTEKLIIREAAVSDAIGIIEFTRKVAGESDFLTYSARDFNRRISEQVEIINSYRIKGNSLNLIAEIGGQIVGNAKLTGGNRPRTSHWSELGITVAKEYWGLGIGSKLIEHLLKWAEANQQIHKLISKIRADNNRSIQLHAKYGFIKEGSISKYFLIDENYYDVVIMGREV